MNKLLEKYEDIWKKVEGFEKEVFCYLTEYYSDDKYIQNWTQVDLENFISDFAENYMRWIFKLEPKSLPSSPDLEWMEKLYFDFSVRYADDESMAKVFKRIDLINRTENVEIKNNPQMTDEGDEEYKARILNIIIQKCEKIIESENTKLKKEAKERFKYLKEKYPNIFETIEYVGAVYGFPLKASLIALDYEGQNIYVTFENLKKWDNTEDFRKIILSTA